MKLFFSALSSGYLRIAAFGIQVCPALCYQVIQHTVQILFLILGKAEQACDLPKAHRLVHRVTQKLHHKFFSFVKISVFTHLSPFLCQTHVQ